MKERPWAEHLTSLPNRIFLSVRHLTTERPCPVSSNLIPQSKYETTTDFKDESWRHTNTWNGTMSQWAWCTRLTVHTTLLTSIYAKMPCSKLWYSITQSSSDMHSTWGRLLKLHTKVASGLVLIRVNFDPMREIEPKVGGGRSSWDYSK